MSQESLRVLKELSMLSTNMDLLVKELREQNKKTTENTDQLKKIVEEKEKKPAIVDTAKENQAVQNEGFFKNLTESFAKQVSDNTKGLTENLTKQITGDLDGITKNLFKTRDTQENTGAKPSDQTIESIAKSIFSKIPKFAEGGDVKKDGVALVGEKGPELVQLKKNQKVISNDDELFLQMELEDMRRSRERKGELESQLQSKTSGASEIVTGTPKLAESVKNKFGVQVPKSEIEQERKKLMDEDPNYYSKYPEHLQEDLDYFIDSYREEIKKEEIAKISSAEALKNKAQPTPETTPAEEPSKKEKRKKEAESKREKEKRESAVISPNKPKLLESLKEKGKSFLNDQKKAFDQKISEAGLITKKEVNKPAENKSAPVKLETEKFNLNEVKSENIKDLTARLKAGMQTKETTAEKTTPTTSTPPSTTNATTTQTSPAETKPSSKETKQKETSDAMTQQDLKEIKALLAGIYKTLSSPLNIANDRPFRPNSNVL